jgi:hypothetical protein
VVLLRGLLWVSVLIWRWCLPHPQPHPHLLLLLLLTLAPLRPMVLLKHQLLLLVVVVGALL